jgi:DNA-binding MarR family transcriptional regulator
MNKFTKYRLAGGLEATVSGKLLYLLLLETVDAGGEITIPQKRIAETVGLSKGAVSRNLRRLWRRGYIDIVPTFHDDGGRAANKYIVLDEK